jgi:hypothetical protein
MLLLQPCTLMEEEEEEEDINEATVALYSLIC